MCALGCCCGGGGGGGGCGALERLGGGPDCPAHEERHACVSGGLGGTRAWRSAPDSLRLTRSRSAACSVRRREMSRLTEASSSSMPTGAAGLNCCARACGAMPRVLTCAARWRKPPHGMSVKSKPVQEPARRRREGVETEILVVYRSRGARAVHVCFFLVASAGYKRGARACACARATRTSKRPSRWITCSPRLSSGTPAARTSCSSS